MIVPLLKTRIHRSAVVDPKAVLAPGVFVGPFCIVEAGAVIGSGTRLESHVSVRGNVRIGSNNHLHPNVTVGGEPQDRGYDGAPTWVVVGDDNVFREGVTVHRGTTKEYGLTRIGSGCYFMACSHVAHDCVVGDHVTVANASVLGGHVVVEDHAALSGMVAVHHFTTVGAHAFVGGCTRLVTDAPPYMMVEGNPSAVRCVNKVGLQRAGFAAEDVRTLAQAHRLLFRERVGIDAARVALGELPPDGPVTHLLNRMEATRAGRNGRAKQGVAKLTRRAA